jgi:hypothetical protein
MKRAIKAIYGKMGLNDFIIDEHERPLNTDQDAKLFDDCLKICNTGDRESIKNILANILAASWLLQYQSNGMNTKIYVWQGTGVNCHRKVKIAS